MRFLFDLQHPAHLHFFRNLIHILRDEGHEVRITGRDKDILVILAEQYGLEVEIFGVAREGVFSLGSELLYRQWRLLKIIRAFKPDAMMAIAGTYISSLGKLTGVPAYVFYDTEHATLSNMLAYPFATCIYVPRCYRGDIRWNHVRYEGYHELAYLHPDRFTPDPSVLEEVGLAPGERFSIIRLVGWAAAHDIGLKGLTTENKRRVVDELAKSGRVFISSEAELPEDLEPYRLRLRENRIHHLMAHAALMFGESATMVSEGAVLGVPGIYIDPVGRGYTDEQERDYGLVFNYTSERQDKAIERAITVFRDSRSEDWQERHRRLLDDKIDVTAMLHQIALERPFWKKGR